MPHADLLGTCMTTTAFRDWCDACMVSRNIRTDAACQNMTHEEKHNTVIPSPATHAIWIQLKAGETADLLRTV